jgi:hypothetical protein
VVAHSEGGRVEVDCDIMTMIKSLRKRTVPGSRWWRALGPGTMRRRALGMGSRTAGGGGGAMVSRATTE